MNTRRLRAAWAVLRGRSVIYRVTFVGEVTVQGFDGVAMEIRLLQNELGLRVAPFPGTDRYSD